MNDWNPASYAKFAGQRLQPALDLLMRIGDLPAGEVIDLGCGTGIVGRFLKDRFPRRQLTGFDNSPAMLAEARATGSYDELSLGDAAGWQPERSQALIYSNALLHWLPDHASLLKSLTSFLEPGGWLAVQIPNQNSAQSQRLWLDLVAELFPGRFDPAMAPSILTGNEYIRILEPLGAVSLWETIYYQRLKSVEIGHPVRQFTVSTFARPILDVLDTSEQDALIKAYDRHVEGVYPLLEDGGVVFPFRRLFFTVQKDGG